MDAQDLRVKVLVGVLVFPVRLLTPTAAENDGWMTPRETHSRPVNKPISAAFRLRLPRMPHPDRDSLSLVETGLSHWQVFPQQIDESVTEPCLVAAGHRSLTPRVRPGWWLTVLLGLPSLTVVWSCWAADVARSTSPHWWSASSRYPPVRVHGRIDGAMTVC